MLAAVVDPSTMQLTAIIATGVVIGLFVVVGIPVILGMRLARFERQLRHTEKMKALELGLVPAEEAAGDSEWTPTGVAAAIGVWVPIAVFGGALVAAFSGRVMQEIWIAAMGIGITAVICGTMLLLRLPGKSAASSNQPRPNGQRAAAKPALDPDVYDTAARRG